jgi:hypothetical protein
MEMAYRERWEAEIAGLRKILSGFDLGEECEWGNPIPHYPKLANSTPPYSHSIVLRHRNALICQRKFFLRIAKHRLADPSEIRALDLKRKFGRSAICSVSETIDIDRSISMLRIAHGVDSEHAENTVRAKGSHLG